MNEQKKFLLKILDTVDFKEDNENFAEMFAELILEEAVYSLIQSLPEQKREKIGKKWDANVNNQAALTSLLKHYFTEKQINEIFEKTASKAIYDYLQSVDDKLDETQREKLRKISEELAPTASQ